MLRNLWCTVLHVVFMGIDLYQSLVILILSFTYVVLLHPFPPSWKKMFHLFLVGRECFILNGSANVQAPLKTFMQKMLTCTETLASRNLFDYDSV